MDDRWLFLVVVLGFGAAPRVHHWWQVGHLAGLLAVIGAVPTPFPLAGVAAGCVGYGVFYTKPARATVAVCAASWITVLYSLLIDGADVTSSTALSYIASCTLHTACLYHGTRSM